MTSPIDWHARARALAPDPRPFIAGARVELEGADAFAEHHPHDGRLVAHVPECAQQAVDRAVAQAQAEFGQAVGEQVATVVMLGLEAYADGYEP